MAGKKRKLDVFGQSEGSLTNRLLKRRKRQEASLRGDTVTKQNKRNVNERKKRNRVTK